MKLGFALSTTALTSLGSGLRPTLDLDFTLGILDNRITFTRGSTATRYNSAGQLETVAVNQPRFDYDPVTLNPKGLLIEEARTNLLTYSSGSAITPSAGMTKTVNAGLAPDGTTTATLFSGLLGAVGDRTEHSAAIAPTTLAGSVYLKAAVSEDVGKTIQVALKRIGGTLAQAIVMVTLTAQWQRVSLNVTMQPDNTGMALHLQNQSGATANQVLYWGAQLEAGAFATSYIPTTSSAATRAADNANMFDIGWLTQGIGTLACEFNGKSGGGVTVAIAQFTSNYAALIGYQSPTNIRGIGRAAGTTSPTLMAPGAINTDIKSAYAFAPLDRQLAVNGALSGTDVTSPVITDADRLMIGSFSTANYLNGHIKRIRYWPTRLPNAKLQELTA